MSRLEDLDESRFISGVYNYCDRWCEKCRFADRCMVYYREQERNLRHQLAGEDPGDWAVVMQDVGESFAEAMGMLQKMADEMGVDLESMPPPPPRPSHRDNVLFIRADRWSKRLQALLDRVRDELPVIGEALAARFADETEDTPAGREVLETLKGVREAYELLCRYCFFIPVKIARAVSAIDRRGRSADRDSFEADDGRGTAKLVHESLSRMVTALWCVAEFHRDWLEESVALAMEAEALRKGIDESFPDHRSFHRPGFDD